MKKLSLRVLAEVAIFAALGFALDAFQKGLTGVLFKSGGSIGIAMLPVLFIAYRRGLVPGLICGLLLSLIQMLSSLYIVNGSNFSNPFMQAAGPFIQVMLDYVLAYTVVGFAGAFAGLYKKTGKIRFIVIGSIIGTFLKYMSHVLAGGLFYLNNGAEIFGVKDSSWLFTFVYNGAYMIPNIIICTLLMVLISLKYNRLLNAEDEEAKVVLVSDTKGE